MATHADVDRGPHLAATYIAGCAISFVFVAMRLCARFSIAGVGIDDWCMLVTWVSITLQLMKSAHRGRLLTDIARIRSSHSSREHVQFWRWYPTSRLPLRGSHPY